MSDDADVRNLRARLGAALGGTLAGVPAALGVAYLVPAPVGAGWPCCVCTRADPVLGIAGGSAGLVLVGAIALSRAFTAAIGALMRARTSAAAGR